MADYNSILARAKEIRDATEIGENTADRVGSLLGDIIQYFESIKYALEKVISVKQVVGTARDGAQDRSLLLGFDSNSEYPSQQTLASIGEYNVIIIGAGSRQGADDKQKNDIYILTPNDLHLAAKGTTDMDATNINVSATAKAQVLASDVSIIGQLAALLQGKGGKVNITDDYVEIMDGNGKAYMRLGQLDSGKLYLCGNKIFVNDSAHTGSRAETNALISIKNGTVAINNYLGDGAMGTFKAGQEVTLRLNGKVKATMTPEVMEGESIKTSRGFRLYGNVFALPNSVTDLYNDAYREKLTKRTVQHLISELFAKNTKRETRIVCRKAIRLGATRENGNLVKYFSWQPSISLNSLSSYYVYLDGMLVEFAKMKLNGTGMKTNPANISIGADNSIQLKAFKATVPIVARKCDEPKLYWIDRVERNGDSRSIYIKSSPAKTLSHDNGNRYYKISSGHVVAKPVRIDRSLLVAKNDINFNKRVMRFKLAYRQRMRKFITSGLKKNVERKTYGRKYAMRTVVSPRNGNTRRNGTWQVVVRHKGLVVDTVTFTRQRILKKGMKGNVFLHIVFEQ